MTVDDPRRWARFTARRFACLRQQRKIDLLKQAVVSPIVEIALHRGEWRKVFRQHPAIDSRSAPYTRSRPPPLATGCRAAGPKAWLPDMRLDQRPFRIRDIACVTLSLSLILEPSDFGRTLCLDDCFDTTIMPQRLKSLNSFSVSLLVTIEFPLSTPIIDVGRLAILYPRIRCSAQSETASRKVGRYGINTAPECHEKAGRQRTYCAHSPKGELSRVRGAPEFEECRCS